MSKQRKQKRCPNNTCVASTAKAEAHVLKSKIIIILECQQCNNDIRQVFLPRYKDEEKKKELEEKLNELSLLAVKYRVELESLFEGYFYGNQKLGET